MPDTKITALTALTAADPANDVLPIVDVSDTTMAASGTTKKISINNVLGASGTATLASATITGDLTVRTNQLIANANGVGVGTAPSAWSGIGPALQVEQASLLSESSNQLYLTANGYFAGGQWNYINTASADQYYQIAGSHVWRSAISGTAGTAIGWSTLMTLNSTGLGVGVSPAYQIHTRKDQAAFTTVAIDNHNAIAAGTGTQFLLIDGGTNAGWFRRNRDGTGNTDIGYKDTLRFRGQIAGTERTDLTIDTSGNVGIGVTPSALSNVTRLEIGGALSTNLTLRSTSSNASARNWMVGANVNAFGDFVIRQGNSQGAEPNSGTDRLVIDADGNLLVGTTSTHLSAHSAFQNNASGQVTFRNTSTTAGRYFNIGMNSGSSMLVVNDAGTGVYLDYGTTSWASTSDERLKDIIEPISNAVSKVGSLRSVIGKFKTDSEGTRRSFLIAQDVQAVLPEAVDTTNADAFGIRYTEVVPLLVAAIKELTAEVNALKNA